jgi:dTDP-4-amino-4,6-dideoxygalactose transaminase
VIPLADLASQYRQLKPEIDAAIARVLTDARFVQGPAVEAFERAFAEYCGVTDAIAVNSGTSALHVALIAAGVRPGDEVITVPFTFAATIAAIEFAGARPVLVDIDPEFYALDPAALEPAITARTRAIVPVHLFGQPADMDPIMAIARKHGVAVIEDAAQAHGAEYKGRRAGSMGDIGCFSFYPAKNLGAFGEGGAAVTSNREYAETMRLLRSWGERRRYEHLIRGFNYRMDGIQGAVLGVKLKYLETWTQTRIKLAHRYTERLNRSPAQPPRERPGVRHVYQAYSVRVGQRDLWRTYLTDRQIQTAVHYPIPIHLQPAYSDLGYEKGSFPVSELIAGEILSLPLYPEMRLDQVEAVADAICCGVPAGSTPCA